MCFTNAIMHIDNADKNVHCSEHDRSMHSGSRYGRYFSEMDNRHTKGHSIQVVPLVTSNCLPRATLVIFIGYCGLQIQYNYHFEHLFFLNSFTT